MRPGEVLALRPGDIADGRRVMEAHVRRTFRKFLVLAGLEDHAPLPPLMAVKLAGALR